MCSVNDFVNEWPLRTVVPMADKLPCGVVESVDDVCATGLMLTGELPPPRYSDVLCLMGIYHYDVWGAKVPLCRDFGS